MDNDYQKSRVYAWENNFPSGGTIKFEYTQSIVNHVWEDNGLHYPPIVMPFNSTKFLGKANRTGIKLGANPTLQTILHEVAHSMTSDLYGNSDKHGPDFVGIYIKLMHKHMNVDLFHMLKLAAVNNIAVNYAASPLFVDMTA